MDVVNSIKHPVYPVNPCLDEFQIADFRKGLTGIDTMNLIRKYPAYPVNPVKNNLETLKWEKCFERSI